MNRLFHSIPTDEERGRVVHINCLTEELAKGVQTVERAAASKDTIPILKGILVDAGSGGIRFAANDLEIAVECTIVGSVLEAGRIVVEAKYFAQIVKHLPSGNVDVKYDASSNSAAITAGSAQFHVNCLPADEFPATVDFSSAETIKVEQAGLRVGIEQTVFATGKDESRPFMTGIYMEAVNDELNLVATDSNRLAHRTLALADSLGEGQEGLKVLVPTRAMNELAKLLSAPDAEVEIVVAENQVGFLTDGAKLTSRLIEARFPNYRQVIPSEYTVSFRVDRRIFQSAVERSALIAKKGPAIVLFSLESGVLTLSSREAEVGRSSEKLEVEHSGDDITIAYQAKFLLDALKAMDTEKVEMRLKPGIGAATVVPVGPDEYRYVLMPVRVPEVMG